MATLIQHRWLRLLAGMNRHQYCGLRMLLPKVITKSTLPDMKCLHTALLYPVRHLSIGNRTSLPQPFHTVFVYTESVKNITLSADEHLIEQARQTARARHTTLNAAFREWLAEFTAQQSTMQEYDALMDRLSYFKVDRKFTRDEMNER
jgi:hypothetical protein